MARPRPITDVFDRPARVLVLLFAGVLTLGTGGLMLPMASQVEGGAPFDVALFTATSAVTVTGLTVVETPDYWTGPGQVVLLVLFEIGGLGIITLGSLAGLLVSRRIGLRGRRMAQLESGGLDLGDVRRVLTGVLTVALSFQAVVAVVLFGLFRWRDGESLASAAELAVFHAVSAFNNAGFTLYDGNLAPFRADPIVLGLVTASVLAGAAGYPVLADLRNRGRRPTRWSLHTKLTLSVMGAVLGVTAAVLLAFEWTNPDTLGALDAPGKLLAATFNASMRTAGFSTIDFGATNESTQLAMVVSMFIGGGSVSAAGGIKVTTLALLVLAAWAEFRGDDDLTAFGRRLPPGTVRLAIAVTLTLGSLQLLGIVSVLALEGSPLATTMFEVTSALGIVGLSTGLTPELDTPGRFVLIALMMIGRLGPLTVGTALVLRERQRLYRFPEERPFLG
jgi:Trk-type K+ transport system membrane component